MNYFEFYPGDYLRDTTSLNLTEHGAYLRLLIAYYSKEKPLPADVKELYQITCAISAADKAATRKVADEFFPIADDGLRHKGRVDEEIAKARLRIDAARSNGKKGGNPLKKAGYNEPGYIYAVQRERGGPIKVGISKFVAQRYSAIRKKVGPIREIAVALVDDMGSVEASVHSEFTGRLDGEWIDATEAEIMEVWKRLIQPSTQANNQAGPHPGGQRIKQPSNQTHHTPHAIHQNPEDQELESRSEPDCSEKPKSEGERDGVTSVTPAGVCIALRALGVAKVAPAYAPLHDAIREGATLEQFAKAAKAVKAEQRNLPYIVGKVRGVIADERAAADAQQQLEQKNREVVDQWAAQSEDEPEEGEDDAEF